MLYSSFLFYIYMYAFSRHFHPKRLIKAIHFFFCICVPWELNPQPLALLTQCSTTEPQEHFFAFHLNFPYLYLGIFSCVCISYNCTVHGANLTNIAFLIIFCIIVYVTNKYLESLSTDRLTPHPFNLCSNAGSTHTSISQTQLLDMMLSMCIQLLWSNMTRPVLSGTCPVKPLY